ncbi:hypothetical protein FZN13_21940, partial [Escherichia coli]|nr:hypothetical protein [Escherichia coli]
MHTFIFLVLIKNINGGGSWNITPMPNTDVCVQVLRTIESHGGRGFGNTGVNRPGFPGECFICELRLPDHRFRWKHNKLFLLLPEEYRPAVPAIVDC